jgi:hypothetical protein
MHPASSTLRRLEHANTLGVAEYLRPVDDLAEFGETGICRAVIVLDLCTPRLRSLRSSVTLRGRDGRIWFARGSRRGNGVKT